ncbi:MAG: PKD domain-containing protein [Candidatus Diapherotrites archaeon]
MKNTKIAIFLAIIFVLNTLYAQELKVSVYPNPFEQGTITNFTIHLPQNETVRVLTIDFYSQENYLFQVSPPISSPTTVYAWNGCYPNSTQCLQPGTYKYVVKAGCGCGGRRQYEATGTVAIVASGSSTGGGTQPPSGCYSTESDCKNNNSNKCNCLNAVNCQYDTTNKCYVFSNCDNTKCGTTQPPTTAKESITTFIQRVAQSGSINYSAIGECPTDEPTAEPDKGKMGYWCRKSNVGSAGERGAIRYWALLRNDPNNSYDDISVEIYIFIARAACQNPPQAATVGCAECVLFLENMNKVHEIPKIVSDAAVNTLRIYQTGGGGGTLPTPQPGTPTPTPGASPQPSATVSGGLTVTLNPPSVPQGGLATFTVTTTTGASISNITIYIFDLEGRLVFSTSVSGNTYTWNARNNNGEVLAAGVYLYKITASTPSGNLSTDAIKFAIVPQQGQPQVTPSQTPASGGGIRVDVSPQIIQPGGSITFTVSSETGETINQISVNIYDLTGDTVYESGWVNGTKLTWNGVGNYGTWNGKVLGVGAYIFVVYAKAGANTRGPAKGYIYIKTGAGATPGPGTSPTVPGASPTTGVSPGAPSPGASPTTPQPVTECVTSTDCKCGDGCYQGRCIHPELTINGSANSLLAYTGKPLETTIVWTITNVGDDAAVIKEVTPTGCDGLTCNIRVEAGATVKLAESNKNDKSNKTQTIYLAEKINLQESKKSSDYGKETAIYLQGGDTNDANKFKFDYGEVEVGLEWKTVKLSNIYKSPIVVAKPVESCTGQGETQCDLVVVRIRNVLSNSFEVRLQKWGDKEDGNISRKYRVQYLVLEEGHYDNVSGLEIEAGKFKTNHTPYFGAFKKNFAFKPKPVLITSIVTFNGDQPAVTRNINPCRDWISPYPGVIVIICGETDFITKIQEKKNRNIFNLGHNVEDIHYIAISPGRATINDTQWEVRFVPNVDDKGTTIYFETDFPEEPIVVGDVQSQNEDEAIMLRFFDKKRDSIHLFVAEEDSKKGLGLLVPNWWSHSPEEVGYVAIAKVGATGLKAVIETDKDGCTCPPCTISFDGSKSTGDIVSYEWDFGDGSTATGVKVAHTYTKTGTYTVKLTVRDKAGNTASATKTIVVGDCFHPISGTVIEPGKSIKIIQKISGLKPGRYEFDLHVKYTDQFGASNKQANEWNKIVVEVAKLGSEKFSVKLVGEAQDFCIGPNGLFGITGKAAVPKVKLSWQFEGDAAIKIDDCDEKDTDDFIYCDPTQFSIELAQKLKKISDLVASKRYAEIKQYTSFKAHLIGDNYSESFQKDFAKAYTEGFLKAPTWFTSGTTPWNKYFYDPNALSFEPRQIDSGLYLVTIDINFNNEDWVFFREGKPDAKIRVRFEKLRDASADVEQLPFYYMSFNGLVGKDGRSDYGLGYENQREPIVISVMGTSDKVETTTKAGRTIFTTATYKDLEEILEAQSKLFKVDFSSKKMELYYSQAVPVLMGIKSKNGSGECFYMLYSMQSVVGSNLNGVSYWTGIATSPDLNCGDFHGLELPYMQKDIPAAQIDNSCAAKKNNLPAFGFHWKDAANDQSIFLRTVFYTPHGKQMSISNACSGDVCLLASKSGISKDSGQSISIDSTLNADKISDIIKLIEQEYVCVVPELQDVHPSQNSYVFFWNESKLLKELETAKARIASEWSFNWQNYKCE